MVTPRLGRGDRLPQKLPDHGGALEFLGKAFYEGFGQCDRQVIKSLGCIPQPASQRWIIKSSDQTDRSRSNTRWLSTDSMTLKAASIQEVNLPTLATSKTSIRSGVVNSRF